MNNPTNRAAQDYPLGEALSALADGERLDDLQWQRLRRAWAADPTLRRDWQLMQLTGEALRAPELAAPAQSAEALLDGLRARLAREPVSIEQARRKRNLRDMLPALAVAAGFVLVALVVPGSLHVTLDGGAMTMARASTGFPGTAGTAAAVVSPGDALVGGEPTFAQALSPGASQPQPLPPQLRGWPSDTLSLLPSRAGAAAPASPHAQPASAPRSL